jgi:hypothetical protein
VILCIRTEMCGESIFYMYALQFLSKLLQRRYYIGKCVGMPGTKIGGKIKKTRRKRRGLTNSETKVILRKLISFCQTRFDYFFIVNILTFCTYLGFADLPPFC